MTQQIILAEKLDHAGLDGLHGQLHQALGQPVELDGRMVRIVGGLSAQLLLAAVRRWRSDGLDFDIQPSEPMRDDLRRLGLEDEIFMQDQQQ